MTETLAQGTFEWSAERIGRVREIALAGGTARDACEAIELDPERAYLLYKLADREGFKFTNRGGKRDVTGVFVKLPDLATSELLSDSAAKYGQSRRDHAAKLLALVLMQGPTFIGNLLDEA